VTRILAGQPVVNRTTAAMYDTMRWSDPLLFLRLGGVIHRVKADTLAWRERSGEHSLRTVNVDSLSASTRRHQNRRLGIAPAVARIDARA
jgi:hypothetical protein